MLLNPGLWHHAWQKVETVVVRSKWNSEFQRRYGSGQGDQVRAHWGHAAYARFEEEQLEENKVTCVEF